MEENKQVLCNNITFTRTAVPVGHGTVLRSELCYVLPISHHLQPDNTGNMSMVYFVYEYLHPKKEGKSNLTLYVHSLAQLPPASRRRPPMFWRHFKPLCPLLFLFLRSIYPVHVKKTMKIRQWVCWTLRVMCATVKIEAGTGGERGRHL